MVASMYDVISNEHIIAIFIKIPFMKTFKNVLKR